MSAAIDATRAAEYLRRHPLFARLVPLLSGSDDPLYLVGGAVRDALLGGEPTDFDFAGHGAIEAAHALAAAIGTRVVMLHQQPATARVPVHLPGAHNALVTDFCALRAPTIAQDLAARDFTINAIALELPEFRLCDPTGGVRDLRDGTIRAVTEQSFIDDPLRCLRAHRLASTLNLRLHRQTRQWLRKQAAGLGGIEGTRVGEELLRLLTPPRAGRTIREMDADGVLSHVLPELDAGRDMDQPGFHHLSVREHAIETLCAMEMLVGQPADYLPLSAALVAEYLDRPHAAALLLMAALLHDVGKPGCHSVETDGRVRFTGHAPAGEAFAARILQRLAWPACIRGAVVGVVACHMRPFELTGPAIDKGRLIDDTDAAVSPAAIRRVFRRVEGHEVALVLTALADSHASRGPAKHPGYDGALAMLCDRMLHEYIDYRSQTARQPLLTGKDLIAAGFTPGPLFSVLLEAVEEARADGKVRTRPEALRLAQTIAARRPSVGTKE